jgi:hypothetical protein
MKLRLILLAAILSGCAHGKMGVVDQELPKGSIGANQTIFVEIVSTAQTQFSGDKSQEAVKISDEKAQIEDRFNRMIANELRKKGFKPEAINNHAKSGLALTGKVTRFEHGSAAARIMVGMGAGSSNLYTDFVLTDLQAGKPISKFEVIATSGGNGGFQASGGYISAHLTDGAEKVADYLSKANGNQ